MLGDIDFAQRYLQILQDSECLFTQTDCTL